MPKISEATVAQHRTVRHRAVLDAAEKLIVERAVESLPCLRWPPRWARPLQYLPLRGLP
jgi:hypothetical protein